ncbi:hypothetical protein [Kordia jejudonensis]|uniref:hypothetical protein n=1 Tax=Kordia jejudonensis TaxID=1348245 RepID=UPI000629267C|nr:hypothetical protein [Kordia jejudonensis]
MKRFAILLISILLTSCTSTTLVDYWKNPDIEYYEPQKVLIVGLTSNEKARKQFENELKQEFELRGTEAVASLDLPYASFKTKKVTLKELNELEEKLLQNSFDAIILSKVIGVEDKVMYKNKYHDRKETYRGFAEEYVKYQDIYYNPEYYDEYTIYHSETSMYCICPTKDRELLWKGYIDIIDPVSIDKSVSDYVKLTIAILEEEKLLNFPDVPK